MRIAHLTDFHLRQALAGTSAVPNRQSRRMAELFPRALEQAVAARVDAIILTGDLVDAPHEFIHSPVAQLPVDIQQQLQHDYWLFHTALAAAGLPFIVIPGNHDCEAVFREVFDLTKTQHHLAGHRILTFLDHEGPGNVPQRVGESRRLFDACLTDGDATPQIHVQHYLVYPERNEHYPHTYSDGMNLARQMGQSGRVRLSLSGHYHAGAGPEEYLGVTHLTTPAFCIAPFPWNLVEVGEEGVRVDRKEVG